ncbi:MAG: molybdopterin cofactor-binding domain-containing protein, partial [Pseudomonadota bacterium]
VGKKAKGSFGAVFAEISFDPITLEIAVERLVGAFDCGRIIDPRIAHGQIVGGMIWGLGQALMEETRIDPIRGAWDNAEIGEALVPTAADIPPIEAIFVPSGEADTSSPASCKSVSELGIYGTPAAIANAVFDATGHRLTSLPLKIEHRVTQDAGSLEGRS